MQLILQLSTHDFLELDELCESVKNATNEKITVTNYIELMIQDAEVLDRGEQNLYACARNIACAIKLGQQIPV